MSSAVDDAPTYLTRRGRRAAVRTTHYLLCTTVVRVTSHYSLLTTYYSLRTTHYSLCTTHCLHSPGAVDAPQFAEAMRSLNSHLTPSEIGEITREARLVRGLGLGLGDRGAHSRGAPRSRPPQPNPLHPTPPHSTPPHPTSTPPSAPTPPHFTPPQTTPRHALTRTRTRTRTLTPTQTLTRTRTRTLTLTLSLCQACGEAGAVHSAAFVEASTEGDQLPSFLTLTLTPNP